MGLPQASEFIRRYECPVAVRPYPEDDPRSQIVKLLEQGETESVIAQFSEGDSRCLNGLTWAYVLKDKLQEAERVAETAVAAHAGALAAALANKAWVKIRQSGNQPDKEILSLLERAVDIDPHSHAAHANRISYASRLKNKQLLAEAIESMMALVPDWSSNSDYCEMLTSDADLTWARMQPCFSTVLSEIRG